MTNMHKSHKVNDSLVSIHSHVLSLKILSKGWSVVLGVHNKSSFVEIFGDIGPWNSNWTFHFA
jgi:hypothetical protein